MNEPRKLPAPPPMAGIRVLQCQTCGDDFYEQRKKRGPAARYCKLACYPSTVAKAAAREKLIDDHGRTCQLCGTSNPTKVRRQRGYDGPYEEGYYLERWFLRAHPTTGENTLLCGHCFSAVSRALFHRNHPDAKPGYVKARRDAEPDAPWQRPRGRYGKRFMVERLRKRPGLRPKSDTRNDACTADPVLLEKFIGNC